MVPGSFLFPMVWIFAAGRGINVARQVLPWLTIGSIQGSNCGWPRDHRRDQGNWTINGRIIKRKSRRRARTRSRKRGSAGRGRRGAHGYLRARNRLFQVHFGNLRCTCRRSIGLELRNASPSRREFGLERGDFSLQFVDAFTSLLARGCRRFSVSNTTSLFPPFLQFVLRHWNPGLVPGLALNATNGWDQRRRVRIIGTFSIQRLCPESFRILYIVQAKLFSSALFNASLARLSRGVHDDGHRKNGRCCWFCGETG
mmetsp:Transcript_27438/g.64314  ORF Transcript_27438/g.64314 Transcript_27438/m.64314 type:complete len:256 (+) Transcript_27438:420-1187(+)